MNVYYTQTSTSHIIQIEDIGSSECTSGPSEGKFIWSGQYGERRSRQAMLGGSGGILPQEKYYAFNPLPHNPYF